MQSLENLAWDHIYTPETQRGLPVNSHWWQLSHSSSVWRPAGLVWGSNGIVTWCTVRLPWSWHSFAVCRWPEIKRQFFSIFCRCNAFFFEILAICVCGKMTLWHLDSKVLHGIWMDHHSLLQKPLVYTQVKRNYETLLNMDSVCFIRMFSIFRMKVST